MKNIILIISIIAVSLVACRKYRWFRPIEWKYIQGSWHIDQILIDGNDSTTVIFNTGCSSPKFSVGYCNSNNNLCNSNNLQQFDDGGTLIGDINIEGYKYKKMSFISYDFINKPPPSPIICPYFTPTPIYDITTLDKSTLIITATVYSKTLTLKCTKK